MVTMVTIVAIVAIVTIVTIATLATIATIAPGQRTGSPAALAVNWRASPYQFLEYQ